MTARIAPGGRREIGAVAWLGSRIAGRVTGTEPPAFITTLGRGRRQFWGWLAFAGSLMPFGTLTRRESESVILRVAAVTGCAYESAHHRHLGELEQQKTTVEKQIAERKARREGSDAA